MEAETLSFLASSEADVRRKQLADLRRMRIVATGLLLFMAIVFVAALELTPRFGWLAYVRAFAEASMVGACADWFAVVALFRHPLGIPIPHTAIVQQNKARIGDTIGAFIRNNFLAPAVIKTRLQAIDAAGWCTHWLAAPGNARLAAVGLTSMLKPIFALLEGENIRAFLRQAAVEGLAHIPATPIARRTLSALWASGQAMIWAEQAIQYASVLLERNQDLIRSKVSDHTSRWIPRWVDDKLADRMLNGLRGTLAEMEQPDHAWRVWFQTVVTSFIDRLETDPAVAEHAESIKRNIIAHAATQQSIDDGLNRLRDVLGAADDATNARATDILENLLSQLGRWLEENPQIQSLLNRGFHQTVENVVVPHRDEIGEYIAAVVKAWDDQTLVDKIEAQAGKDLQYIRINGALVGGLVGLIIFTVARILEHAPLLP